VLDGFGLVVLKDLARPDFDALRLHRLRHFAHQIDLQKPILKRSLLDLDKIGKAKATLEIAGGDPTMHVVVLSLLIFQTRYDEGVLLHRDANLVGLEASDRQGNAVAVLAGA
jgi:hypothetical protein